MAPPKKPSEKSKSSGMSAAPGAAPPAPAPSPAPAPAIPVFPAELQPLVAILNALKPPAAAGVCDRGDDVPSGIIVLNQQTDSAVFDFYLCRMNGAVDIVLTAVNDPAFRSIIVHSSGQAHTGLTIPVQSMPAGGYSLVWQFTGIRPADWKSCAEFTRNDTVIMRTSKNENATAPIDHGTLSIQVR